MLPRFEELPGNVQALILAKLAVEIKAANARSIHHLAIARRTDVRALWRIICRKAAQQLCTIPVGLVELS
jgi:hypothetical protein